MSREDRAYSYVGGGPAEALTVPDPLLDEDAANRKYVNKSADIAHNVNSVLTISDAWTNITNRGAAGPITLTLPDAFLAVGRNYFFIKLNANDLIIKAAGTDVIQDSVTGGTIRNNTVSETFAYLAIKSVQTGASSAKWSITTGILTWATENNTFSFGLGGGGGGLNFKAPARVATDANIVTILTAAPNIVDGVTLSIGDRVLVKSQTTASENGTYSVNTVGTGADGIWSRSKDADENQEVVAGMLVIIEEGTVNADTAWLLTTDNPITIGSTSLNFTSFPNTPDIKNLLQADSLAISTLLTIPIGRQMIVVNKYTVSGTLTVEGLLFIL